MGRGDRGPGRRDMTSWMGEREGIGREGGPEGSGMGMGDGM